MKYSVAVDIGGTNTRVALVDEHYTILKRVQFATDANHYEPTLKQISETVKDFGVEVVGIGLSCPGPLDLIGGRVLETPNLKGDWWGLAITEKLSELTQCPVYLENDANLAGLAEAIIGQGKGKSIVQFITVSTGLGAGLVINGKIFQGAHGFANEVANAVMKQDGPSHGTIVPGGIEAISSGTAITLRAQAAGLKVEHAGQVNDLAKEGNELAQTIMEEAKQYLANFLGTLIAIIDPDVIVLGGSVALKIDGFVEEVSQRVKANMFEVMKEHVHIVKSNLNEDSGLLGAACLAFSLS